MSRWSKTASTLEKHEIFGDEEAAAMRAELQELTLAVADLSAQLHAQFTTIAAHAEIAREQSDFARDEARADLERTRSTLIELIDQARRGPRAYPPPNAPAREQHDCGERMAAVERRLDEMSTALDGCVRRQRELTEMMTQLLDTVVNDTERTALTVA